MKLQLITLPLLALTVLACSDLTDSKPAPQPIKESVKSQEIAPPIAVGDNSQNSLDWNGRYSGITPCASCEGIKTELILYYDNTYKLVTIYLGKSSKRFIETGKLKWNEAGAAITLHANGSDQSGNQYQVGENQLFMLDREGQRITSELAEHYRLAKEK